MISDLEQIYQEPAIIRGIKAVGVGKKGSRDLSPELARAILNDLKQGNATPAQKGAFFAGLIAKGMSESETILWSYFPPEAHHDLLKLVSILSPEAPVPILAICAKLLSQAELNESEISILGNFLFSQEPGDGARGIAASALRVRYESLLEYSGLLKAITQTYAPSFQKPMPLNRRQTIIQLAEPFDGVDHNYLLTPCLADEFRQKGFCVLTLVGQNSGPKNCFNLYDIAQQLGLAFLPSPEKLAITTTGQGGWYLDQKDLSPALDRWVKLRHQIVKRPFLATLERLLNPCQADIVIASAFHGSYGDKMMAIAQAAGTSGIIIVRNGVEGTLAFPLSRPAKFICAVKKFDGKYLHQEMILDSSDHLGEVIASEQKLDPPSFDENVDLIRNYFQYRKTKNPEFDKRVKFTLIGLQQAIDWIMAEKGDQL